MTELVGGPRSPRAIALLLCALARAGAAAPTKAEYCAAFEAARDAPSAADWTGELVDLFSPDDAACAASRRYVDLAPDAAATLHVSASGTDANCSQTWGTRFNASTTVDPTLAPTDNASVRTTSFISKVPPGSPLYADAQAGALNFTLVLGAALGARVIKWNGVWSGPSGMTLRPPSPLRWNGVYDGRGGDVGGETMPPSDCDNFWQYGDAAPRAEATLASGLPSAGRLFAGGAERGSGFPFEDE